MRWKINDPKTGEERTVTKFLWIPKRLGDEWVWLEYVRLKQRAMKQFNPLWGRYEVYWKTIEEKPYNHDIRG